MEILEDHEVFLYQERAVPYGRSFFQFLFGKQIYRWRPCYLFNQFSENLRIPLRRLSKKTLQDLAEDFVNVFDTRNLGSKGIVLLSKPDYNSSFEVDGAHSDIWKISEKGVNEKTLQQFQSFVQGYPSFQNIKIQFSLIDKQQKCQKM